MLNACTAQDLAGCVLRQEKRGGDSAGMVCSKWKRLQRLPRSFWSQQGQTHFQQMSLLASGLYCEVNKGLPGNVLQCDRDGRLELNFRDQLMKQVTQLDVSQTLIIISSTVQQEGHNFICHLFIQVFHPLLMQLANDQAIQEKKQW